MSHKVDVVASVTEKMTYGGAGTAVVFGLTANEINAFVAIGGFVIVILTYITNVYFNYKRLQIESKRNEKDTTHNR